MNKIVFFLSLAASVSAKANTVGKINNTSIKNITCRPDRGWCEIVLNGSAKATSPAGLNSCSSSMKKDRFFTKVDTPLEKATFSLAMMAFTSGKKVNIRGIGSCSLYEGVEDLGYIRVQP